MITEETLIMWTKPASNTEENKCDSTIANIESCIKNYNFGWLKQPKLKLRGSYKNNTNVKNDSDVDMYVLFEDFCYSCNQNLERIPAINANGPTYKEIKDAVYCCLQQRYGADSIVRGHKSIKVKNNTYRVKADVVSNLDNTFFNSILFNISGAIYKNLYLPLLKFFNFLFLFLASPVNARANFLCFLLSLDTWS